MQTLRGLKHRGFLVTRRARFLRGEVADLGRRGYAAVRKPRFDGSRYPLDFTALENAGLPVDLQQDVPRQIFCIWAGDEEMTENRKACLESMQTVNEGIPVIMVTPENLDEWIVPEYPLHPAYPYLSTVHRADYLKSYLLHFHGGGCSDIKKHHWHWGSIFDQMNADPEVWVTGYRLPRSREATDFPGELCRDIRRNYSRLVGYGAMMARAQSPLTAEWLAEVNRRLDYHQSLLQKFPGNTLGDNPGYPVAWTRIGSQVFEPLCFKYLDHVRINPRIKPQLWGHR